MPPPKLLLNLLEKVQFLNKKLSEQPQEGLYETVFYRYHHKIMFTLQELLHIDNEVLVFEKLKNFLAQNWQMVQGNALCYTALAQEPVTQLLCALASELALSPLAKKCSPLELLMPEVECESMNHRYPNLDTLSLHQVLTRYIVGRDATYLIPIEQLLDEEMGRGVNFYFSLQHSQHKLILQQEELYRLINHSHYSQNYAKALKDYQDFNQDNSTLLSQLKQLTQNFYFNSKDGIGTEEQAGSRAYNALIDFCSYYEALDQHEKNKIPALLHNKIKQLIDVASSNEPHLLEIKCIGKHRESLDELIKNDSDALACVGLSNENKKIRLEQKKQALDLTLKAFNEALETEQFIGQDKLGFSKQLMDDLAITDYSLSTSNDLKLLMQSKLEEILLLCEDASVKESLLQQFTCMESLVCFMEHYPVNQCAILLELIGLQLFMKHWTDAQQFILFLNNLDDDKFSLVLLFGLKNQFMNKSHVMLMQHILTPEKKTIFFNKIQHHIIKILPTWNDIKELIKTITIDELSLFVPEIEAHLFNVMQEYSQQTVKLDYFLELSSEKQQVLLKMINKSFDWMLVLDKAEQFQSVLSSLIRPERSTIFELIQRRITDLIHSTEDLLAILSVLSPQEKTLVLENAREQLPKIIQKRKNITQLFKTLTSDQKTLVVDSLEADNFIKLVTCEDEYKIINSYVSEKKRACFDKVAGHFQHTFFKSEKPAACGQAVNKYHMVQFNQKNV